MLRLILPVLMYKKMIKRINTNKGFTLLELLVVIAIIGVLVTIIIVAINPAKLIGQSRDSKRRSDLLQVKAALQLYYNDCKTYPATASFQAIFGSAFGNTGNGFDGTANTCDDGSVYMKQVPNDTGASYTYTQLNSGQDYRITAHLNYPTTDDANTVTKCGGSDSFSVCND